MIGNCLYELERYEEANKINDINNSQDFQDK